MKIKRFNSILLLIAGILTSVGMASCSPEKPENEKKNKLHEDPVRAVFTLQEGTLSDNNKFDNSPRVADFKANGATTQVIEWQTTPNDGCHVTRENTRFKFKNSNDTPTVVYLLKMEYYNAAGKLMNDQFYTLGQDKIHQHFFSTYKQVTVGGSTGSVRVSNKAELPYDYRYADELNGSFVGETNPMGFQGFIRFVKPGKNFTLSVDLLHAAVSKFDENNKPSPFYLPAKSLVSTGVWDIQVKLPIEVDGASEETVTDMIQPAKVRIDIYEGHLHGPLAFHQNTTPEQNKYMGRNYKLTYRLEKGRWVPEGNDTQIALIGCEDESWGRVSAFDIHYFDKNGKEITGQIVENGEDRHYQHFFQVSDIKPAYGGKEEATDKNSTEFFKYLYCDTDPWNKTNHFDKAPFIGKKNPIGLKGYFYFKRSHKKFNMEIKLMRARQSKMTDGQASPFYAPTSRQTTEESWLPTISIPINIYMDASEKELKTSLDDFDKLSKDEKTYPESDRLAIRSLMEAFGIKDFTTALAEFYWNLKGESKHETNNFWF